MNNYEDELDIDRAKAIGSSITNIMSREPEMRFAYLNYEDIGSIYILFIETHPWNFNDKEKNLTEDELTNICKKYMTELGILGRPIYIGLEY